MAFSVEWRDKKYSETFEEELRGLERRRAAGSGCTITDLEGSLRHLYMMDGSDQGGRGGVQDTAMAATIAAYEHFVSRWKAELSAHNRDNTDIKL